MTNISDVKLQQEKYSTLQDKLVRLSMWALALPKMAPAQARLEFLRDLEVGRATGRAERTALARILFDKLGVSPEDWIGYLNEELEAEVQRVEAECGITGYDEQGNPVFAQPEEKAP